MLVKRQLLKIKLIFIIVQVAGDGNCLFRSLAICLEGPEDCYNIQRTFIADFLCQNRQVLGNTTSNIDELINDIRKTYCPASYETLYIAS